jgi:ABC-type nitrate/sulfonate/bicarbonate transport system substrate-binding protein
MIGQSRRLLFALAAGLVSGALMTNPSRAQAPEVDAVSMSIGVDLPFLVHIVAREKGWFRDAGFRTVDFKTFSSGNLAGEALLAGQVHLWTPGNLPPISMAHNGIPVVVLGTNAVSHGLEKLVVRKDAHVENPEDLYRAKLGLLLSSTSGAMLANIAKRYGLDASRIQAVNLAPPEAMASLANNEIQGIIFWEPWPYKALHELDTKLLHTGTKSFFKQNHGQHVQVSNNRTVWVASEDFVRRNPNATKALVRVLLKTQEYVRDPANRDEVLKIYSEFQKQPLEMNKELLGDYTFDPAVDEAYVQDMAAIADFLESTNRISSRKDILTYTYTDPMKQVDRSLAKVEGKWKP